MILRFRYYAAVALLIIAPLFAFAESLIPAFDLEKAVEGIPKGWRHIEFHSVEKPTSYKLVKVDGHVALEADSEKGASAVVYPVDSSSEKILRWKWKIKSTLPKGDARKVEGDDYAARIYVIFRFDPSGASLVTRAKYKALKILHGRYPPHATLNYIWANRLPKREVVVSPYTDRSYMVATESGNEGAGQWIEEEVDIAADYRKIFGEEPPLIEGIGIMTDTDNTGSKTTAWYCDIELIDPEKKSERK